jgi:hypothetical protein
MCERMPERTYTDEQVREILRRAVERSAGTGGIDREDLIAAATDVGIEADAVHTAIVELERERELQEEVAKLKRERRRSLASNFGSWAIVSSGLFGIDWATGGGWWFYWPLGGWGLLLLLELKGLLLANPAGDEEQAVRRIAQRGRQRQREQAEQRRQHERERRQGLGGLEGAVERGVEELLGAAARRIAGVRVHVDANDHSADPVSDPSRREPARGRRSR